MTGRRLVEAMDQLPADSRPWPSVVDYDDLLGRGAS